MDQITFMEELFANPDIKIKDLKKGLTNQNFLLQIDDEAFVLRTPRHDSEHIVNRHHETLALNAIAHSDIDVETIYYDEASGYKVTKYIPEAQDYNEYQGMDKVKRTAQLMKKFHSLNKKTGILFDPSDRYLGFQSRVTKPLYDVRAYEDILHEVCKMKYDPVLCHNDWVEGNILFTDTRTYLIDYEYAADNDPLFDVMSFITENKITDMVQREEFYRYYFDDINDDIRRRLLLWENYHNLLWCEWAMMMWEHRKEPIYKEIAKDKYEALLCSHKQL